ncbi:hydrogenase maturation nickel metallochaperone HypA [Marinisporobacter balticus]|uniref:Hydrogenase maturation factor HypA n=1 Tax=Marinisporobacter balticus TaxID=2018667 RepID=A0A4R2KWL1_9FIRM|nr:hydrogenase maturation nickel metallochaperone HypA [Marinisporobacter balticus]TCO74628.1 hydrogenase-3 nickel incorporation protein HypA [Marinisporobacter balticus]
MHEVSVVAELFEIIYENVNRYNLKRVDKIILRIGEFTCIEENGLRFAFEGMSKETICENAALIIQRIKARAYCDACKESFYINYTNKICPKCNQFSSNIMTGYELLLEKIEGE